MTPNSQRRAGVLIPLFACPSASSWGIGDIGDIQPVAKWLAGAGQRVLQLLPMNEMASGQQSPYSAMSAMAKLRVNGAAHEGPRAAASVVAALTGTRANDLYRALTGREPRR